jgi:hypothetical protein
MAPTPERLDALRRRAARDGLEVVSRHGLHDLERARAYEAERNRELSDQLSRLRRGLVLLALCRA